MMTVTGEDLIARLQDASNDKTWSEAAKALEKIENAKRVEIENIIAEFANVEHNDDEDFEDEVRDILYDLGSSLDMNTEYMELDLAEGSLQWWVNSYC